MATENIYQRVIDLTDRIFQATSGLELPRGDQWQTVVTVFLTQANERLNSVRVLLEKNHWDSAVILARSLFELAVNLAYIAKNTDIRLPQYLKHGGIPLTEDEAEQLLREIEENPQPAARDIVPGQAWNPLKGMCADLGPNWLKDYETFYRYASVPTHAGAFTLGSRYKRLLLQQPPPARERATALITASTHHLRVAEITAKTFPEQIKLDKVMALRGECQQLGLALLKQQASA
ncbi:MAG: hypothetical protein HY680_00190 [Chloroflexi bacterium]|nr:hypothetical protein [Chloroflexota bacterium]